MIISMSIHGLMLAAGATLLLAPQGTCACGPLTLPSPPPQRPWMWHEAQGSGERGECARRPAHLPTTGPTTTSLTDCLTELLTDAPSIPTPNSTPNRTICARSSRARRNRRRAIALRQKPSHHARRKSWGLRLNPIPTSVSPSVSGRSSPDSSLLRRCYRQGPHFTGDCTCDW